MSPAFDRVLQRRIAEHLDREEATIEELERRTTPMTSPTQRRHNELRDLLTEIRNRLPEPTSVVIEPRIDSPGQPIDWPGLAATRAFVVEKVGHPLTGLASSDPVDVTEECGTCTGPSRETVGMVCQTCGTDYAPDAALDVTEEPPVGSQLTDKDGDVWHRFSDGWTMWDVTEWGAPGGHWAGIRYDYAPLRPTTDADRERVGLPVDTAPDVDPDEALAEAIRDGVGKPSASDAEMWATAARAAREHIEADVERLTRERDAAVARAERAELSVDRSLTTTERVTRERDEAQEVAKSHAEDARDWRRRHKALRADVETKFAVPSNPYNGLRWSREDILARDDQRGRDA